MLRLRNHRRHLHSTLAAVVAVAALVGQASLLHVHAWRFSGRGETLHVEQTCDASTVELAASGTSGDTHHDRTTCAACQALAQGRQLAVGARTLVFGSVLEIGALPSESAPTVVAGDRAGPAAPRAPPALA